MAGGFSAWTRLKNDDTRETCDASQSSAPLKYVTYAPEYLTDRSCTLGMNANNCRVYDVSSASESALRIGALTNRRELMRESTNVRQLGVPTAPHQGNGPLLNSLQLGLLSSMRGGQEKYSRSCDVAIEGQPVTHHLDMQSRINPVDPSVHADKLLPRGDIYMSTRVQRRNAWAAECRNR